ncbi:unnamed protein product [Trichobilharzia regenti]|nr:unnamed protein product [Trichobilharzia regenti]
MKATQLSSSIGDNTKKRDDPPSSNPVTTTAVSNNLSVLSESNRISHEEEVSQRNNANDESHEDYQRNSLGHHQVRGGFKYLFIFCLFISINFDLKKSLADKRFLKGISREWCFMVFVLLFM